MRQQICINFVIGVSNKWQMSTDIVHTYIDLHTVLGKDSHMHIVVNGQQTNVEIRTICTEEMYIQKQDKCTQRKSHTRRFSLSISLARYCCSERGSVYHAISSIKQLKYACADNAFDGKFYVTMDRNLSVEKRTKRDAAPLFFVFSLIFNSFHCLSVTVILISIELVVFWISRRTLST